MVTRDEVEAIALLARLHLEDDEVTRMQADLAAILEHFGALAAVATDGVEPMTHAVPVDLALRADQPGESLTAADAVRAAAVSRDELFVVPAVIPGAGSGSG
jgi:aspartyl-tRNA(Asn)/glutamyl-tRNA(Gln) amidotransferase subunit C